MAASPRAFVLRHTRLRPVPYLEELRLHLADDVYALWHDVQLETDDPDAALPYWAFAWGGGLAIGRYVREHPELVAGRRVFDLASGSGLCAIAAMRAGAAAAAGSDIDPFALAAMRLNARANDCRIDVVGRDVLDEPPPDTRTSSSPATAGTNRGWRSGSCPGFSGPAMPGSRCSSAIRGGRICRSTTWSSSPRTTSGRRPTSRTCSERRATCTDCERPEHSPATRPARRGLTSCRPGPIYRATI